MILQDKVLFSCAHRDLPPLYDLGENLARLMSYDEFCRSSKKNKVRISFVY